MTNDDIATYCYSIIKAGQASRRDHSHCPFPATDKLRSMLHSTGWVYEDLRLALMKHNPAYRATQIQYDMVDAEKENK